MKKSHEFWVGAFWVTLVWLLYAVVSGGTIIYKYPELVTYTINLKIGQFIIFSLSSMALFILFRRYIYPQTGISRQALAVITGWLAVGAALQWLEIGYDYLVLCNDQIKMSQFVVMWSGKLLTLLPTLALFYVFKFLHHRNVAEQKQIEADRLARDARLQLLTYQLNPHFLFNALNTIMALIDIDKDEAREIVADLADYLRYSLGSAQKSVVTMAEEYQSVLDYLKIQKKRFKDKIAITTAISEAAKALKVPVFIVHPLIDNAIKHGAKTSKGLLQIDLAIETVPEGLRVVVRNSGTLTTQAPLDKTNTGTGLANTRSRLALLFGEGYGLTLDADVDGVRAVMTLGLLP